MDIFYARDYLRIFATTGMRYRVGLSYTDKVDKKVYSKVRIIIRFYIVPLHVDSDLFHFQLFLFKISF